MAFLAQEALQQTLTLAVPGRLGCHIFPRYTRVQKRFRKRSAKRLVSGFWNIFSPAAKGGKKTALWKDSETQVARAGEHLL